MGCRSTFHNRIMEYSFSVNVPCSTNCKPFPSRSLWSFLRVLFPIHFKPAKCFSSFSLPRHTTVHPAFPFLSSPLSPPVPSFLPLGPICHLPRVTETGGRGSAQWNGHVEHSAQIDREWMESLIGSCWSTVDRGRVGGWGRKCRFTVCEYYRQVSGKSIWASKCTTHNSVCVYSGMHLERLSVSDCKQKLRSEKIPFIPWIQDFKL